MIWLYLGALLCFALIIIIARTDRIDPADYERAAWLAEFVPEHGEGI